MPKENGLLVVDKPGGITSRAVVNRVQTWFPRRTRVGHMGTLDPLATGVLVLGIGEGTRLTEYVQNMDKVYRAGILLGASSDTDDADGTITPTPCPVEPSAEQLQHELSQWIGEIDQVPPDYSAVKVTGRRAYDLSRRGTKVALTSRKAHIYQLDVISFAYPNLHLEIRCGKGTYIRSLARDLGKRLGCGGLIASLRRLRIGPFTPEQAISLETAPEKIGARILPLHLATTGLSSIHVDAEELDRLRHGQAIMRPGQTQTISNCALLTPANELAGIGRVQEEHIRPVRMLNLR